MKAIVSEVPELAAGSSAGAGLTGGRAFLVLALTCFLLYFTGLGAFPAIDPAEGYYVEAAREMVELGNYIVPYLNDQIYFSKPILTFWLIAGSYKLFGLSEWAARLPFALLSSLLVFAVFWATRALCGGSKESSAASVRAGLIAGLALASAPLLLLVSRTSPVDIAFSVFLCLAVLGTAVSLAGVSSYAWLLIYSGLALALLAKGPAALLLYGIAVGGFLVVSRPTFKEFFAWLKCLRPLAGALVFLAVALPWHYLVYKATDGLFLRVFFLYENLARFAGHTNMGKMSWWFFIPTILAGFFPFIFLLPPAMKFALGFSDGSFNGRSDSLLKRLSHSIADSARQIRENERIRGLAFLLVFASTTFVFFSLSGTKLITYILPVLAPLAVLIGVRVDLWLRQSDTAKSSPWLVFLSFVFVGFAVLAAIATVVAAFTLEGISPVLIALSVVAALWLLVFAVLQFRSMRAAKLNQCLTYLFAGYLAAQAIFVPVGFHIFGTRLQGDLRTVSLVARDLNVPVSMFGVFMPSSMFYAGKAINTFFVIEQVKPGKSASGSAVQGEALLIRDLDLGKFSTIEGLTLTQLSKAGEWGLYMAPGFEVETIMTLEEVFKVPSLFDSLMKGTSATGPLTVPYARGKAQLGNVSKTGVSLTQSGDGK